MLRPPAHRVSRKAILWWTLQSIIAWLILIAVELVILIFASGTKPWLLWILAATVVIAIAHTLIMPQWRYRVHRWEVTADAVYTLVGWINQEWRVAPISRIQTVDTQRGPLQQVLGLSAVTVTTASAAGPLHISGLEHNLARRVVEELTATTQATPGDAT